MDGCSQTQQLFSPLQPVFLESVVCNAKILRENNCKLFLSTVQICQKKAILDVFYKSFSWIIVRQHNSNKTRNNCHMTAKYNDSIMTKSISILITSQEQIQDFLWGGAPTPNAARFQKMHLLVWHTRVKTKESGPVAGGGVLWWWRIPGSATASSSIL